MSNPSVGNPKPAERAAGISGRCVRCACPMAMPKLPGRAPGITTLVIGILLMVVVAPIVFFGIMIAGVTKTEGNAVKGGTTANGSIVTVTADGKFTVTTDGADPACFLMDAGGTLYQLTPYKDNEGVYTASGIPAGQYKLQCERIASSATVVAFNASPEVMTQAFVMPFVWEQSLVSPVCRHDHRRRAPREGERQASPHHAGSHDGGCALTRILSGARLE